MRNSIETMIFVLERTIAGAMVRDEKIRAENPGDPYINLSAMEDVEVLEEVVALLRGPSPAGVAAGAPGDTDAERAAWLADKIVAGGDYAKEAAAMLRRWPSGVTPTRGGEQ